MLPDISFGVLGIVQSTLGKGDGGSNGPDHMDT